MRYEGGDNTLNDGFITGPAVPINIINKYFKPLLYYGYVEHKMNEVRS